MSNLLDLNTAILDMLGIEWRDTNLSDVVIHLSVDKFPEIVMTRYIMSLPPKDNPAIEAVTQSGSGILDIQERYKLVPAKFVDEVMERGMML